MGVQVEAVATEVKFTTPNPDTVVFQKGFDHCIVPGSIPNTVTHLDLHFTLINKLEPGAIPDSVTHLCLNTLTKDMAIPESVTDLFVEKFQKDMIDLVPVTVVNLHIHANYRNAAPQDRMHYLFRFYGTEIVQSMAESNGYITEGQHTIKLFDMSIRVMKRVPKSLASPSSQAMIVGPTYTDITFDTYADTIEFPDSFEGSIRPGSLDSYPKLNTIFWGKNMRDPIEPEVIPDRPIVLLMPQGYQHQITDNVPSQVAVAICSHDIDFTKPDNLPSRPIFFSWNIRVGLPMGLLFCFTHSGTCGFRDADRKDLGAVAVYRTTDGCFNGRGKPTITKFSDYWAVPKLTVDRCEACARIKNKPADPVPVEPKPETVTVPTESKPITVTVPTESKPKTVGAITESKPKPLVFRAVSPWVVSTIEPDPVKAPASDPNAIVPVLTSDCIEKMRAKHLKKVMPLMRKDGFELALKVRADVEAAIKGGMLDGYRYTYDHKQTSSKPYSTTDFKDVMTQFLPAMRITPVISVPSGLYFEL